MPHWELIRELTSDWPDTDDDSIESHALRAERDSLRREWEATVPEGTVGCILLSWAFAALFRAAVGWLQSRAEQLRRRLWHAPATAEVTADAGAVLPATASPRP